MEQPRTSLLPAYLAVGADQLKRRRVLERLRANIAQDGSLEFNHDLFEGERDDGASIVDACNTLPFASARRLVEVAGADKLKKADAEAVIAYLIKPCETTVLVMTADKLAATTRLRKAVAALGRQAVIDCAPLRRSELSSAVCAMARTHGFTLTNAAAARLIEHVGEDTVTLDAELRKLALAHQGADAVNDSEVASLVARTSGTKPWELANAFAARDLGKCLHVMELLPKKARSPFALLALCTARLRELVCARCLSERGQAGELARELGKPAWQVKEHVRHAQRFPAGALEIALASARDAERAMKGGRDAEGVFIEWLVAALR